MLKLRLPFSVGAKGVARVSLALGLKFEHFSSVIKNGGGRVSLRPRPFRVRQRTKGRRLFPDANVPRDQIGLLQRNVKFCFLGELQNENFLSGPGGMCWRAELQRRRARGTSPLHCRHFDEAKKSSDAVLEMDDKIAFVELAEINLRAIASFRATQTSPAMNGKTPEQFVRRENDEVGRRKTKSAAQCSFDKVDVGQRIGRNDLAKALDLPLGLKIDRDGCVFIAPLLQPRDELCSLCFREHEVADREFSDVAFDERTGKIFRRCLNIFDPAFANLNVAWRGKLRRALRRRSCALQCGFELDHEGILCDVVADSTAAIVSRG